MACGSCGSERQEAFAAEMNIHLPGPKGLEQPALWTFPRIEVCLDCGLTLFTITEAELRLVENGRAA